MADNLGTFVVYKRTEIPEEHPFFGHTGILWAKNQVGDDWYDVVSFQPTDGSKTFVLVRTSDNKIVSASNDVSSMFPDGHTVYAIPAVADVESLYGQIFKE